MKKITLIIHTAVIVATGLLALVFKQYVNVNIESLLPVFSIGGMLYVGYKILVSKSVYRNGKWYSYGDDVDFKYSKNKNGEGSFSVYKPQVQNDPTNIIPAYTMFIGSSLNIPLIVFFDYKIKLWSIGIMLICAVLGMLLALPFDIKKTKKAVEDENQRREQWERELEEQKKREEMGKWK